jgi:alpha/beta superfamily hydrolase
LHPHSLMGGDMWNPVVETVARALFSAGICTLRFNFRGVGGSSGCFDEGRGEQEDLLAALAFLEERGLREIMPAGYSFGAWVSAGVLGRRSLAPAIFVAPPIVIILGLALAYERISLSDLNFEFTPTMSMNLSKAKLAMGVKSLRPTGVFPRSGVVIKDGVAVRM